MSPILDEKSVLVERRYLFGRGLLGIGHRRPDYVGPSLDLFPRTPQTTTVGPFRFVSHTPFR
jgi:hypothetical protein